uniref:LRRNT domain-containing protein n=1 Tax=Hucho hucho TaxID=62062 RepID=A0A4W5MED5_9TELE
MYCESFPVDRGFGSWLFTLPFLLLLFLPLVFPQCPDSCHCVWESSMVLCTDAGLREFPQGLPPDTVTLHLERNYIRSLPEGAFRELTHLRELYLSHNHINTLSSGALRHLSSELRLLDLSHNLLRQASRDEFGSTRAKTRLYNNPWHCDCTLQELMETLNLEPETVNGIVSEHSGQPLVKLLNSGVNFCSLQRKTTDVAMLVTMFVWFFMVIVYVVYYVRRNQAETRRHLEYLKSLPSPKKTPTETDTISTGF